MNSVQIALSFAVVIGLFGVIFAFLASLARLLERTARRLGHAAATVTAIRENAAVIGPAVEDMNQSLYVLAANLLEVGGLAETRRPRTGP